MTWLLNLLRGDLGISYASTARLARHLGGRSQHLAAHGHRDADLAWRRAWPSASWPRSQYGFFDNVTSFISYFGLAMPVFWFGLMLQILFAVRLGWLPSAGMYSATVAAVLGHRQASGATGLHHRHRQHRRLEPLRPLLDDRGSLGRTTCAPPRQGMASDCPLRHVLRNALIPFVTVVGIDVPLYLTGAVLTETVYSWPGMGASFMTR